MSYSKMQTTTSNRGRKFTINKSMIPEDSLLYGATEVDCSAVVLGAIVTYVETGKVADLNNPTVDAFGKWLGLVNEHNWPREYWALKLREDWLRRNLHTTIDSVDDWLIEVTPGETFNLYKTRSLPDQQVIPAASKKDCNNCYYVQDNLMAADKFVVAGGSVLASLTKTSFGDIDYFYIGDKSLHETVDDWIEEAKICADESLHYTGKTISSIYSDSISPSQLILRRYRSVEEILLDFDLDCIRCATVGGKFYVTPTWLYSITHGTIFIDLNFYTPAFHHRLVKYFTRGFDIWLPIPCDSLAIHRINSIVPKDNTIDVLLATLFGIRNKIRDTSGYEYGSAGISFDVDPDLIDHSAKVILGERNIGKFSIERGSSNAHLSLSLKCDNSWSTLEQDLHYATLKGWHEIDKMQEIYDTFLSKVGPFAYSDERILDTTTRFARKHLADPSTWISDSQLIQG